MAAGTAGDGGSSDRSDRTPLVTRFNPLFSTELAMANHRARLKNSSKREGMADEIKHDGFRVIGRKQAREAP